MSQFKKYASALIFVIFFTLFAVLRGPGIVKNWRLEGTTVEMQNMINYKTNSNEEVFKKNYNYVVMFWASWCGPCILEMERFKSSVEEKRIPAKNILALNPFETPDIIKKFLVKNDYPFQFLGDGGRLARKFEVRVTPTTLLIENGVAETVSSGVSPLGVSKAESLFGQ
ncbi:MAG: redoxin domain-containing protein [Bacteriovoracaceae bacterium]|nr:redoxin domain-containing protein [Bacteriovoracaceae bacterium]